MPKENPHEAGVGDRPGDRQPSARRDQRVIQPVDDQAWILRSGPRSAARLGWLALAASCRRSAGRVIPAVPAAAGQVTHVLLVERKTVRAGSAGTSPRPRIRPRSRTRRPRAAAAAGRERGAWAAPPGGTRWGSPSPRVYARLLRPRVNRRPVAAVSAAVEGFRLMRSRGFAFDEQYVRDLASRGWDRGYDPAGCRRQLAASASQPNRAADLPPDRRSTLWSSTGWMTRWSRRAEGWRSPGQSPTPASWGSRAWVTTCPGRCDREGNSGAGCAGRTAPPPAAGKAG